MKVLFTKEQIAGKVKELAARISKDYEGKDLECVVILKGAVIFASDLVRALTIPVSLNFITLGSYEGTQSSGSVRKIGYFGGVGAGKHILIVEDIIDTGTTLDYLKKIPSLEGAASIKVACLLDKKICRKVYFNPDYTGFEIPDKFVVGYGMDVDQKYRNLPDICIYK